MHVFVIRKGSGEAILAVIAPDGVKYSEFMRLRLAWERTKGGLAKMAEREMSEENIAVSFADWLVENHNFTHTDLSICPIHMRGS
jgi:hypothetical protein